MTEVGRWGHIGLRRRVSSMFHLIVESSHSIRRISSAIRRISLATAVSLVMGSAGRTDDLSCDGTMGIPWSDSTCDGYASTGQPSKDFVLIGRGGLAYSNVPGESQLGGSYGVELALPLREAWWGCQLGQRESHRGGCASGGIAGRGPTAERGDRCRC